MQYFLPVDRDRYNDTRTHAYYYNGSKLLQQRIQSTNNKIIKKKNTTAILLLNTYLWKCIGGWCSARVRNGASLIYCVRRRLSYSFFFLFLYSSKILSVCLRSTHHCFENFRFIKVNRAFFFLSFSLNLCFVAVCVRLFNRIERKTSGSNLFYSL